MSEKKKKEEEVEKLQKEIADEEGEGGDISPTFYEQLLQAQIPKALNYNQVIMIFLRFWDLHV